MHWKGLWHSFARHGEVVVAYIASKLSRGGKRFGFVRMGSKEDAERAVERLHGFRLYGSKLTVKLARDVQEKRGRFGAWKRINIRSGGRNLNQGPRGPRTSMEPGDLSSPTRMKQKHITDHIEEEDLWKMRKCLVGEMATICSVSNINNRLQNWGTGDIKVQRMVAKTFLLTIDDEDLYLLLEDLQWSYL
ncbi:hypothetical protein V6N13_000651 [Hibiscus sabdariffa]